MSNGSISPQTFQELSTWFDLYTPEYLTASKIAHQIEIRYEVADCSAQRVNQVLHQCFGDTNQDSRWEIPQYVPGNLYQWNGSVYEWHKGLIPVIYDQMFGDGNPLKLRNSIDQILDTGN